MTDTVKIISPIDGRVYAERQVATGAEIEAAVTRSRHARAGWSQLTIKERAGYVQAFLDALLAMNDEIVPELAWQMGRPVRFGGEKRGLEERGRHMIALAESALARVGSGVVVLGAVCEGKVQFIAGVSADLVKKGVHAGKIIKEVAKVAGGSGGGQPGMARAGGKDAGKIAEAVEKAGEWLMVNG